MDTSFPTRRLALTIASVLLAVGLVQTQGLDICGCANFPGLQPFDAANSSTWPPGTTLSGNIRFVGESEDSHCDRFWAKALRHHAAANQKTGIGAIAG